MAVCAPSNQLGLSLARQAARLSAAGGPSVVQALSSYIGELPPLDTAGSSSRLTRGMVEAFGGLYYYGELEETSLMALAELVVEERYSLNITDRSLFQSLEDMAAQMDRGWYEQARRNVIFAQMLGFGGANDFRDQIGSVVDAVTRLEQSVRNGTPTLSQVATVEFAFGTMLNTMGSRAGLGLERAAQVLNGQLRASLALLGNTALHRMFQVRDMWELVHTVVVAPQGELSDTASIVDRAQAGAAIIGWAAGRLQEISAHNGSLQGMLMNDAALFRHAARWAMGARTLPRSSAGDGGGWQSGSGWSSAQPGGAWGAYDSEYRGGGWA